MHVIIATLVLHVKKKKSDSQRGCKHCALPTDPSLVTDFHTLPTFPFCCVPGEAVVHCPCLCNLVVMFCYVLMFCFSSSSVGTARCERIINRHLLNPAQCAHRQVRLWSRLLWFSHQHKRLIDAPRHPTTLSLMALLLSGTRRKPSCCSICAHSIRTTCRTLQKEEKYMD